MTTGGRIIEIEMKIFSAVFLVTTFLVSIQAQDEPVKVLKDNMKPYYSVDGKSTRNYPYN